MTPSPVLAKAPIDAIALDLVRGAVPTGPQTDQVLVGGVIDGHNIWRGDLAAAFDKLEALRAVSPNVAVGTSTSLFHTPHDLADEPELPEQLKSWLAFADEKVGAGRRSGARACAKAAPPSRASWMPRPRPSKTAAPPPGCATVPCGRAPQRSTTERSIAAHTPRAVPRKTRLSACRP